VDGKELISFHVLQPTQLIAQIVIAFSKTFPQKELLVSRQHHMNENDNLFMIRAQCSFLLNL
jgi:hypothetical protein